MTAGRFAAVAAVLGGFDEGRLSPAAPVDWLEDLEQAGVHPASLLFCGTVGDLRRLEPLKAVIDGPGRAWERVPDISHDTIVAWSPLTYAHEIEGWRLRSGDGSPDLPDRLLAMRPVTVEDDSRVRALGRDWAVVGRLRLRDLARLRALAGPLEVFGDLELEDLPALEQLEPGLRIHGNLTVARCPALAALPVDLVVDGAIWFDQLPAGFQPGRDERLITRPWPGLAPAPVPIEAYPPGVQELAARGPVR